MKKIFLVICFVLFLLPISSYAFVFWLKSSDNTVENIVDIEKTYNLYLPLVGFIYDPRDQQDVIWELKKAKEKLWDKRIYHITLSPNSYSAQEVIDWKFDAEYNLFFKTIRELNLKVIFRTMHEMNGWWYPWSSNPDLFKQAWVHVWKLSRKQGLTQTDILFDFSVNHRDMPTKWVPSQSAILFECETPLSWKVLDYSKECYRFEDYYPWDKFVDIVWVTFYNWWKATSDRKWKTPSQILNDKNWNTLTRLKKFDKPLFIDEVWTTAVWYSWDYSAEKSKNIFDWTWWDARKDKWLLQLSQFLSSNHFIGAVYFNVDYTYWLKYPTVWEADWAIVNLLIDKFYQWFWDLYSSSKVDFRNILALFWVEEVEINSWSYYVPMYATRNIKFIDPIVNEHFSWDDKWKSEFYKKLVATPSWQKPFDEAIRALSWAYVIGTWSVGGTWEVK